MPPKKKPASGFARQHRAAIKTRLPVKRDAEKDQLRYEAKQRAAELAVLTSVQKALASESDIQKIYDTVGEKVRQIFKVGAVTINVYDLEANTNSYVYGFEAGKRTPNITLPINKLHHHVLKAANPTFLLNTGAPQFFKRFGAKAPQGKLPKSALSIKLGGKSKQVTAVVLMDIERENAFTQNDVRLLQALANNMQVALENARLFDETNQRNAELAVITEVQGALAKELDLHGVYRAVGQKILKIFKTQTVTLRSFDVKNGISYFDYAFELGKEWTIKPYPTSRMIKYILGLGRPFLINEDIAQFMKKHRSAAPAGKISKSYIFVPYKKKGPLTGAITIEDMEREHAFSQSDVRLLESIANSLSVALENARLFDELQKRNQEITDSLEQQTATSDILRAMASSPSDLEPVLVSVAKNAAKLCEADDVQIYSVDGDRLKQVTHWGPLPALKDGDSLPLVKGLVAGRAVLEKRTIHTKDATKLSKKQYPESVKLQKRLGHRTVVATPLIHEGKAIGLIAVRRNIVRPFTDNQITLLKTFADQAAIAIENVRLFDETAQRNAELAVINSVQQGLASRLKFQEIIDLVGEKVGEIFKADTVTAGMYDAKRDWVTNTYYVDRGRRVPLPDRPVPRPSLTATVLDTRKPLLLGTLGEQEKSGTVSISPVEGEQDQNQSVAFVPILAGKRAIGAISVQSYQTNAYDENDLHLLQTLASSMSVALENARLFDETAQRNAELAVINSVQQGLAKSLNFQEIVDLVGQKVGEIFKADTVIAVIYDAKRDWGTNIYHVDRGTRLQFVDGPIPRPSLTGLVIDSAKPLLLGTNEEAIQLGAIPNPPSEQKEDENESVLFVPILAADKVIGVLSTQSYQRNAFDNNDLHLLQTLANSMAVALENARLFDETAQRNAELAIINSVQEGISSKLDVQAIYELVGEKLREVFQNTDVTVGIYDSKTDMATGVYVVENGLRLSVPSFKVDGIGFLGAMIRNPQTLVINENMEAAMKAYGSYVIKGTGSFKSMVDVPLLMRGEVVGVLRLQDMNKEHAFSEADVRLLETIAKSVSIALENARLFDETAQRNAELAVINSVQSALAKELNIQAIYEAVGNKIREIFDAQGVILFIYDAETDMLNIPYTFERGQRFLEGPYPMGGFNAIVRKTGKSILVNENWAERAKEVGSISMARGDPLSYAITPIQLRGKFGGTVVLMNFNHEHAFSDSDMRLLETLANSMSVAMDNARLFEESNRLLEESRKKEAELTTVNTVGQAVASEVDLDALIQLIGDQVQKIFNADIAFVALYDKTDEMIRFPYIKGETLDPIKLGEGIVSQIIRSGKPVLINRDENWKEAERNVDRVGKRAKSYLGVPILAGRRAIGAISVQSTQREGRFNEADTHLLSTIAANVGAAIENARLFAEVAQQKQYFETFFRYSPAAAVVVDFNGTVISWNPAAEALFGYTAQEAIGHDVDDLVAKDPQVETEARGYTKKFTVELGRVEAKGRRTRKDGSLVDVELKGLPISVNGEMVGFLAIYHDISEFEQARRAAEEANQAKSAFLANMSHELRTPLNAIIGFTRIVRRKGEETLPEKQVENLDKVLVSAEHLLGLINTILDIAKIEAGRMDLQLSEFDLNMLIDNSLATSQPLLKEGVELQKSAPAQLPRMHSDQEKIHRILLNLLSNAAKFTHQGSIKVIAETKGDAVEITVQDTGIGIAPENLSKIFEEFQQADNTTTRQYGGTGLGLSISRSLAQLLGGDLTVTSEMGEGSAFHLTVPIILNRASPTTSEQTASPAETKTPEKGKQVVLVIDDQPEMFQLLEQNLEDTGYQVIAARNGEEGLEKARSLHPYAITLDIMMPQKDGWQVLYELKNDPQTKDIPVIMLTIVDNKAMGLRLGASDYLVKPLDEKSVLQALNRLAKSNGGKQPKKLLVVDDDPKVVDLIHQMLEGQGFEIEHAKDGSEGIISLEKNQPDVILLDLLMPKMDGFQFINEIQKRPTLRDIPIVVLTAKSLSNDEETQLASSVAGILKKQGLGGDELMREIRKLAA